MSSASDYPPATDYLPVDDRESCKDALGYASVLVDEYGEDRVGEVYHLVASASAWMQRRALEA